jgi:uncharacterized membrane protein YkvA (DUF1232 family)
MEERMSEAIAPLDDRDEQPRERATRFYDRIRRSIQAYVDHKGGTLGKTAEYLLLVPDVFILLWRLANDSRVDGKDKILLGSAVAYFLLPFDFIPEAIVGPVGFLDDLVFGAFVLHKMLTETNESIVREHWSGSEDVLSVIQRVLATADSLIGSNIFGKVKKMASKD